MIHDFDPSGEDHDGACMCPCCDQAAQEEQEEEDKDSE